MAVDDIERGMAQEEQGCTNSSSSCGGGGRYKKAKQKRPPQRGLGVAQLEKLRLEEQQKMAATAGFIPPLGQQQPFIFFPLPSADLPPSDSLFDSLDLYSSAPPAPPAYNFNSQPPPAMWNSLELNNHDAAEKHKFQTMLSFRSPSYTDFSSIWHSSGVIPRNQSQQQQQPSSMVNVPSSPSSSSGVNLQMEPPSNQSYCSNSTTSWSEGERMIGMKRHWPFSLDDLPGGAAPFHYKLPPIDPYQRRNESPFKFEPGIPGFRKGPSSSKTICADDVNLTKPINGGYLDGSFLTLGSLPTSNLKSKQPISIHSEFDSLQFQGNIEYKVLHSGVLGQQQQPFYSFLPMGPNGHPPASGDRIAEGADAIVDLNLKL